MIEICNVTKRFGKFVCLDQVSLTIPDGIVYGLVGENGAGKSTLLRLIAGVYRADAGQIRIDGKKASTVAAKKEILYMPDRQYYDRNATPLTIGHFYRNFYAGFSMEDYRGLLEMFGLEENALLDSFSKGMKKQVFLAAAICTNTRYLLCDEVFDGLDPQVRKVVNGLLLSAVEGRKLTLFVVSHYLEELDRICNEKGYLHRGRILTEEEWMRLL
ncbi:MAG: ATP-binding cassette domain-containing protein [Lachnospiraceae bacterium]